MTAGIARRAVMRAQHALEHGDLAAVHAALNTALRELRELEADEHRPANDG